MTFQALRWCVGGAALLIATSLAAQGRSWGRETRYLEPIRKGVPERRTGFMFCRLQYERRVYFPSGHGWGTDYPRSDRNFMTRLPQFTYASVMKCSPTLVQELC